MFSQQQAQTGKRVYGGVSQSPNRGQVSAAGAQGYIKRELANKNRAGVVRRFGKDGKSDNRSAVAAQALQRKSKRKPGETPGTKPEPTKGSGGRPVVPGQQDQQQTQPQVQQVQITADGILQLPYNQNYSSEQLAAITGANDELLALKAEGDQQAQQYGQGKRDSQLAYNSLRGQTLNENAAGGTAFSSRYGTAVANNATGYANQMGDLEAQNTGFLQNQGLQRTAIQSSLNQQLAALAQQYADDLNGEAGGLGYGQNTQPQTNSNKDEKAAERKRERNQRRRKRQRDHKKDHKKGGKK